MFILLPILLVVVYVIFIQVKKVFSTMIDVLVMYYELLEMLLIISIEYINKFYESYQIKRSTVKIETHIVVIRDRLKYYTTMIFTNEKNHVIATKNYYRFYSSQFGAYLSGRFFIQKMYPLATIIN